MRKTISIVIPVFNEQDSIGPLTEQICLVMKKMGMAHEIIFIDDGSTDNSLGCLEALCRAHQCVKTVPFKENRGQSKAFEEGFRQAKGEIIVTMDGDLQNDPAEIPLLLAKFEEGSDVICGWRYWRSDTPVKKIISRIGNLFFRAFTGLHIHDASCSFRAYRREVVADMSFQSRYDLIFLPYILYRAKKIRLAEIPVHGRKRLYGKSKYSYRKQVCGGIVSFVRYIFCGMPQDKGLYRSESIIDV